MPFFIMNLKCYYDVLVGNSYLKINLIFEFIINVWKQISILKIINAISCKCKIWTESKNNRNYSLLFYLVHSVRIYHAFNRLVYTLLIPMRCLEMGARLSLECWRTREYALSINLSAVRRDNGLCYLSQWGESWTLVVLFRGFFFCFPLLYMYSVTKFLAEK